MAQLIEILGAVGMVNELGARNEHAARAPRDLAKVAWTTTWLVAGTRSMSASEKPDW